MAKEPPLAIPNDRSLWMRCPWGDHVRGNTIIQRRRTDGAEYRRVWCGTCQRTWKQTIVEER